MALLCKEIYFKKRRLVIKNTNLEIFTRNVHLLVSCFIFFSRFTQGAQWNVKMDQWFYTKLQLVSLLYCFCHLCMIKLAEINLAIYIQAWFCLFFSPPVKHELRTLLHLPFISLLPIRENLPSRFKFKEYCPMVFRNLRERFAIDDQDYQVTHLLLNDSPNTSKRN